MIPWLALKSWKLDLEKRYLRWKLFLWEFRWAWHNEFSMSEQRTKALYEQFMKEITKHAEAGDARIQYILGIIYGDRLHSLTKNDFMAAEFIVVVHKIPHDYLTKDEITAVKWFTKAAKQGHASAQYELGLIYFYGDGVETDSVMATKWFIKAAEQGNTRAQCQLGEMYEGVLSESYVSPDYATAIYWYTKAAHSRRGNQLWALFLLKRCARKWDYLRGLTKAAEQGHVIAQYKLGLMYYHGVGLRECNYVTVDRNYATAVEWFTKAARRGYAEAQFRLGEFHISPPVGHGEVDDVKAAKWFTKAAEQGHAQAQYQLGRIYCGDKSFCAQRTGTVYRVEVDYVKAFKWLTKAVEQGTYGVPESLLRDTVEKLNTLTAEIIYNSTRRELSTHRVNNIASVEALLADLQK